MPILQIKNLSKVYKGGFTALKDINLDIKQGEIFALLGPNGAGKTTLISTICGLVNPTSGSIKVAGHDNLTEYKDARSYIGLVPQELTTDAFISVKDAVSFSRALFGKKKDQQLIESILKDLSLLDKKDSRIMALSGGMKRRMMIAKALSHEPKILFLDEPTAGVDVQLRESMWELVHKLRENGVTIILTTHYIEEAEEMADRIGVINKGQIVLVEEKKSLMKKLGKKELTIDLKESMPDIPEELNDFSLKLHSGLHLTYSYDDQKEDNRIGELIGKLSELGIEYKDLKTKQSSLEEIFVELVK